MAELKDHLQTKIPEICRSAGMAPPRSVIQLHSGVVNPAFCVNDSYIVRFNVRDLDIRKFKREEIAFNLLERVGAPVPKVIWLDESRTILDADILITERLRGQSISNYWGNINNSSRANLAGAAAKILAQIHEVGVNSFGPLDPSSKKYGSWTEFLGNGLQVYCQKVSDKGIFSNQSEIERKVWMAFKKVEPLLTAVCLPKLIHGDFHFANLIGTQTKISGVVDFEWSIGGDPDMDFRNPTNIHESAADSEPELTSEYKRITKRQPNNLKIDFYRMLVKLELMPISLTHWLGKVPWGEANHAQIMKTFDLTLNRLLTTES